MISRVNPDGTATGVASGTDCPIFPHLPSGTFCRLEALVAGADGNLYAAGDDHSDFTDDGIDRIWRIAPTGTHVAIAGDGSAYPNEGGAAATTAVKDPRGVAVGSDGSVYFSEADGYRVRKIDPDGIITTVAGTGVAGFSCDGGFATSAQLDDLGAIAIDSLDRVYLGQASRVRRIGLDGRITTVAGTGISGYTGEGGLATSALIGIPDGLAIGPDGGLYISAGNRVRVVDIHLRGLPAGEYWLYYVLPEYTSEWYDDAPTWPTATPFTVGATTVTASAALASL